MGGFSIWHWLIVLAVVLLIFGTKRLTSGAKDLGGAVKEFKKGMRDDDKPAGQLGRSEEHTSELQSLMRISYAVFCLKKQNTIQTYQHHMHDRSRTKQHTSQQT